MSTEYIIGVIVGVLLGLLVLWLCCKQLKIKKQSARYDERQLIARGKAFRTGFFTILIYCVVYAAVNAFGAVWCKDAVGMFIGCLVGVTAFVLSAIRHDAYFGVNEDVGSILKFGGVVVFFCLVGGIINIVKGELIEDGLLTGNILSLLVAVMWVIIIVAQKLHDRKSKEQEDE